MPWLQGSLHMKQTISDVQDTAIEDEEIWMGFDPANYEHDERVEEQSTVTPSPTATPPTATPEPLEEVKEKRTKSQTVIATLHALFRPFSDVPKNAKLNEVAIEDFNNNEEEFPEEDDNDEDSATLEPIEEFPEEKEKLKRSQIVMATLQAIFKPVYDPLYCPKTAKELVLAFRKPGVDINARNSENDAPIHSITKTKCPRKSKWKREVLYALLSKSPAQVNLKAKDGMTALHFAALECDVEAVKVLLVFGADPNALNDEGKTPLDLLDLYEQKITVEEEDNGLVVPKDGLAGAMEAAKQWRMSLKDLLSPDPKEDIERFKETLIGVGGRRSQPLIDCTPQYNCHVFKVKDNIAVVFKQLKDSISHNMDLISIGSTDTSPEMVQCLAQQFKDQAMLKKAGSRMLFLDGGGIKGLVLIEILSQIEMATGKQIVELFDWIVGTSIGGVLALGLVHVGRSLKDIRQDGLRIRDEIFAKATFQVGYNTSKLERIYRDAFGDDLAMDSVKYPRVLIAAVNKQKTELKLEFFNNCFENPQKPHLNTEKVWKVARYTSAAPLFFTEMDDYVDGGVLANNPSIDGLATIMSHHRKMGQTLPISLVVSVGTGIIGEQRIGSIDAQEVVARWRMEPLMDRVKNLATLLSTALTESESSAETCQSFCEDKDIPFFRLNPRLNTDIFIGEPNLEKIFSMILQTQNYLSSAECKQSMDRLMATIQQLDTNCVELDARYDSLLAQLSQVN
eukprot:Em0018g492a